MSGRVRFAASRPNERWEIAWLPFTAMTTGGPCMVLCVVDAFTLRAGAEVVPPGLSGGSAIRSLFRKTALAWGLPEQMVFFGRAASLAKCLRGPCRELGIRQRTERLPDDTVPLSMVELADGLRKRLVRLADEGRA